MQFFGHAVIATIVIVSYCTSVNSQIDNTREAKTENSQPGFKFFFKVLDNKDLNNQTSRWINPNPFTATNQQPFNPLAFQSENWGNNWLSNLKNHQSFLTIPNTGIATNQAEKSPTAINDKKEGVNADDVAVSSEYDDSGKSAGANCELSITTVKRKKVCRDTVIFQDNFNQFNESIWTKESFIPSYSASSDEAMVFNYFDPKTVIINENRLEFVPKIMEDEFVRRGSLKLDRCTGTILQECERNAQFHWILPPVSSGRITTKNSFSFKYGTVEITAGVPKGDWLVPEMWLVPKDEVYGPGLQSGKIAMFVVRGNRVLESKGSDLGYKVLESSLFMSSQGKVRSRTLRVKNEEPWQLNNIRYSFSWRPDEITVSTNGIPVGNLVFKNLTDTLANLVGYSYAEEKNWFKGTALAPFDQEFYISLGLSVGGREFPDDSISGTYQKPWKSRTVKEMLNFWMAKDKWEPTWKEPPIFKILRVKVKSL